MYDDESYGNVNMDRLQPDEVYDLQLPVHLSLPIPEFWSYDINSILLTALMYEHGKLFVLAIYVYVQTGDSGNTKCDVLVVLASWNEDDEETTTSETEPTESTA